MTTTGSFSDEWKVLWAKSGPLDRESKRHLWKHPLWKHMLDAAAVSLALRFPITDSGWTDEAIAFLTGLHDVGKADSCFQHQVSEFSEELERAGFGKTGDARCRHERISAKFIKEWLTAKKLDAYTADAISRTIIVHHGYWNETARQSGERYEQAQRKLADMLYRLLASPVFPDATPQDLSAFGMRLAGHIVLCDWIASNEEFFCDTRLRNIDDPETYFKAAKTVARDWVKELDLERKRGSENVVDIVTHPRPIQQTLLDKDIPPGLVIIEAPMGEGKTEAAWILAEKWRAGGCQGMYMALPSMATSDSLFIRYRDDYLKKLGCGESVKLVHGMAWLRDDKEPEKSPETGEPGDDRSLAAAWFRPTRRAMLAAHGVGTVDQAMLAGMNVKFGFLRLYGLAGRVLVIDEVHAYDAYMSAIIARLLQWCACMKIPVILLSATLSSHQRAAMIEAYGATGGGPGPNAPYPLITVAEPGKDAETFATEASSQRTLKIVTLPGLLGDAKKTARKAEELVKSGGCCCVILNTVKQAQAVYRELKLTQDQKLLFHARFTAIDRQRIAGKVLELFGKDTSNRPDKFVLVATQVVEQSLDVDFDHMISEIAPIDLLLQRSGREHRHRKRENDPILYVLLPGPNDKGKLDFGGTGYVYAEKPLLRTLAILAGTNEFHLPSDFRRLIECCYGTREWPQNEISWELIRKADQDWDTETQLLSAQGNQSSLCKPNRRFFSPVNNDPTGDDSDDGNGWRAKTRLGANDKTAVLIGENDIHAFESGELPMNKVRDLYQKSIKLPNYLPLFSPVQGYLPAVEAKGKLKGLILLPLNTNGSWQGEEKEKRYEISYDKELGLWVRRMQ